jgi:Cobalamin biosynthesis protein CbiG
MFPKGVAIVSINPQGVETATKIRSALKQLGVESTVYAPKQCLPIDGKPIDGQLSKFIQRLFCTVDAIVAVMAAGIIIRAVAPCLKSKLVDPAVVCVDVAGKSAVSLLSGHFGGANELTKFIASGIGAAPVVTTASDVLGRVGVDEVARFLYCSIKNPRVLVEANTAVINGEPLTLILDGDIKVPVDPAWNYSVKVAANSEEAINIANDLPAGAIVTRSDFSLSNLRKPFAVLKLRRVIVGVGARKVITQTQVLNAIYAGLKTANIPLERVDELASVDIKKDSEGMLAAANQMGLAYTFFSVAELRGFSHPDLSPDSEVVQSHIGVGGVSERAALMAAGRNAHLILKRIKLDGVTVAIAVGE